MALFKNASPENIMLGADDKGSRALLPSRDPVAQHVPLIYMYAQKGPTDKMYVSGAKALEMFGSETFNHDGPYANHATMLAEAMYGAGNTCMVKRIVPEDAGVAANLVLYVDVISEEVPNYVRDSLGNKVIDSATNDYKVDTVNATIPGTRVKFITESVTSGTNSLGLKTAKAGTMVDANGNTSTMYPIMEAVAAYQGEFYNNIGFAIESLYKDNTSEDVITNTKSLPYNISLVTRNNTGASPQVLRTLYGTPSMMCSFKDTAKDPVTGNKIDIRTIFNDNWFNETNPLMTLRYNDYEGLHIYQSNIDYVLNGLMALEKTHISTTPQVWDDGVEAATIGWFDFSTDDATELDKETYLINLFTGKSTHNIEYFTVRMDSTTPTLVAGQKEVHISKDAPLFLSGGSDGTLDNTNFEAGVVIEMAKYLDSDSEVIDNAINIETHLYDSGFTVDTKLELFNFIGVRKDTGVVVGTHDVSRGNKVLPLADTRAIAVMLKTRAKLTPESDYFGTPVSRAVIMGGAYTLYSGTTDTKYPITFDLATASARMMGAGNYKWKSVKSFDHGANAELHEGYAYEPKFIPAGVKPLLWNAGLVWAQPKDRSTYFIPAVQTVYDDDTSPMNTWYTQCALITLNRVSSDAWREFTGTSTMSDSSFKEAVLSYLNKRTEGIFDGIVTVIPEVIITDQDEARGYSWQVKFKLYAANMKTKMVSYTEVYRLNDLTA